MTNEEKLLNRKVEEDTTILRETMVDFGDFKGLLEQWSWEGVSASSLILLHADVGHMEKDKLIDMLFEKMQLPRDPQTTFSAGEEYIYVNFGFSKGD